jgi:serine/threonine protein kinase
VPVFNPMSDQAPKRPEDPPALGIGQGQNDSQLRLVTAEGNVVFPGDAATSDDTPTIISKSKSSAAIQTTLPTLSGGLRGRKLAHFELLEPIGVGGMAAVLRARDTQLDRFVALKILPPEMAQDQENIRRFHQEARAAARLDHENIARVFFCGEDQRLHFIAFEFVEGANLRVLLEQRGRLPVAEAVRIILQIATGLEHAASRGVVHRDVKPSNIIISPNGRAKLVDMGLARSLEPHHDGGLTQSGVTLGTFDYISPEQALEPREADSRSDIYSLGCTFYHMLTGQAPVPEGTAAKKLHHHQHLIPVDPRQFNPDVPDEVAAVLGRMMAKDPKARYQRPVHLVQHLLQVAQKVGATDDVPEGALFVDAELPGDPRKRPLLLVSIGALALAVVLLLLSLTPPPPGYVPSGKAPVAHGEKPIGSRDSARSPGQKLVVRPPIAGQVVVGTDQELDHAVKDSKGNGVTLILANLITLPEGGLVLQGDGRHNLKIVSESVEDPKTIRFKYVPRADSSDFAPADLVAGLTLDGGTVTFQNIIFEIEANDTPARAVAAVGVKGHAKIRFQSCTFVQTGVPQRKFIPQMKNNLIPVACVAVDNPGGDKGERPKITFDQCDFRGGQVAIGVHGPAEILPQDCAFKPYGSLFHLRGDNADYGVTLKLNRCSALVINGPAFRLDDKATCELRVKNSIFSHPYKAPSEKCDEPDLIRQTSYSEPLVQFEGKCNCYHNLNALWVRGVEGTLSTPQLCTELDEFRTLVRRAKGQGDSDSFQPGKDTAIWASPTPWKEETLNGAFLLLPIREVRATDGKALGFEKCVDVTMVQPPLRVRDSQPAEAKFSPGPKEKVVDPDVLENPAARVFNTLFKALLFANPGDVVYIKHGKGSRDIQVEPMVLDKPNVDVILKPFPGSAPIINLDNTQESEPAFFKMYDGKLVAEQLEFVLDPDQVNFKTMTVVFMGGNASCTFKNCVITMRPSDTFKRDKRVPLSVVTLADTEGAMKMAPQSPRAAAEIHLVDSFIRGEGEVLTVRASRPLDLEVNNTMVVLAGSLLGVQASAKEPAADASGKEAEARVRLNHVSALLSEPLLVFHSGRNPKGFIPTLVDRAQNSLFVGLGDKPFVLIEASDSNDANPRDYLVWTGEHNAYGSFEKMLAVRPEEGPSFFSMNGKSWMEYYRETDAKFPSAPLSLMAGASRSPWTAAPDLFMLNPDQREELLPLGAVLSPELLPSLAPRTAPSSSKDLAP